MIRFRFSLVALLCAGGLAQAAPVSPAPPDSIGVEYRNNTALIRHRVAPGETLYGLARRYKVAVDAIVEANPKVKGALISGQVVLVPRTRVLLTPAATASRATTPARTAAPAAASSSAALALPRDAQGNRVYVVKPGQTLYAIAQRFGVSSNTLLRQNRLGAGGRVLVGQKLIIVPAGGTASGGTDTKAAPVRKPAPASVPTPEPVEAVAAAPPRPMPAKETPTPREEPRPVTPKETPRETAKEDEADEKADENRGPARASEVVKRVTESGLAAVIPNNTTVKYLALHKTAPVGSIVEVRNIMNNVSVFVRVIGVLPDTGENSNILIRLSPRAVQMLGTPDQRFRVETSYLP
ncbi:LysM peptidoglycan-binding domain-containing protein [Hymenobacter sp. J193]|uniref:LysM peptidoglycan-binding domain-containing protein n=1 Tax=Hymenobacter sp. J193 TaxID=2898429 RepID=UPI002150BC23|nr:LysM peptidoglycan-binding domain-containing protein [Hymenobacter sp. J193]MCR5889759.1 LysM peptidoglycan-binding domain-containing protein [Hymenobacter sp. J193]